MHHYESHGKAYFAVFLVLCVLTAVSVVTDVVDLSNKAVLAAVVLSVSTAKALFVMMFFMHLKFEGNWKYLLLTPTLILASAIPLALAPDIAMHYYTLNVPQELAVPPDSPSVSHDNHPAEAEH